MKQAALGLDTRKVKTADIQKGPTLRGSVCASVHVLSRTGIRMTQLNLF